MEFFILLRSFFICIFLCLAIQGSYGESEESFVNSKERDLKDHFNNVLNGKNKGKTYVDSKSIDDLKRNKKSSKSSKSSDEEIVPPDFNKLLDVGRSLFEMMGSSKISLTNLFFNPSSFTSRSSGSTGRAGVIDWLARLIGVQGKTLGEFLREYQVHVLYDLVFVFFKWIFFLYAGLLIP